MHDADRPIVPEHALARTQHVAFCSSCLLGVEAERVLCCWSTNRTALDPMRRAHVDPRAIADQIHDVAELLLVCSPEELLQIAQHGPCPADTHPHDFDGEL